MTHSLILAITKIGDLLLKNKITMDFDGHSIDNIKLHIPEYQRPYKWTPKNVNQLFDDMLFAKSENKEVYRVGTLILHYDGNRYNIVDGQQRTITFALLLMALGCDTISFLEEQVADNSNNNFNITNNYRTLKRRVKSLGDEDKDFSEYVQNQCELIVVITNEITEAFQFFDSQNARGKKLYPHDLLKAYHLREMNSLSSEDTEKTVKMWEDLDQKELSSLFTEYLYRLKEWIKGNKSYELNEHNIDLFKGVTAQDNYPYAQFYKGAYAYADHVNQSTLPFVTGMHKLSSFQLDTPIVAGRPFFEYAKHYFDILIDIKNNDKYEGYFINDNPIIKTLNLRKYRNGVGNRIVRLMLDTAILLYIDRFCSERPSKTDLEYLDQFVVFAFVWSYSLRAQYYNVGWMVAQNYIAGDSNKEVYNAVNIYKVIVDSDSPIHLLSALSDIILPLPSSKVVADKTGSNDQDTDVVDNYLQHFINYGFYKLSAGE